MTESVNARLTAMGATVSSLRSELLTSPERFNLVSESGAVEIDLKSGAFKLGALPNEPQTITVTAGDWSASELPANALEFYKFIGDQVIKIPVEYRESAELTTRDESFDKYLPDLRTTLTYRRLETDHEAAERAAFEAGSGVRVSGAEITILSAGKVVARLSSMPPEGEAAKVLPFVVEGGQVFVSAPLIEEATARVHAAIKTATTESGLKVVTGLISETGLCEPLADTIRQVIRDELKPGGMLHRAVV
ncbi:MAG: hypothetical protein EOP15_00995 [Pseudomonas sp.]|nr:MAG: hypothetical protein EOP15_00995 [Pseudomonas sp.]